MEEARTIRTSNQTERFGAFHRKTDGSPVENEKREAAREKREKENFCFENVADTDFSFSLLTFTLKATLTISPCFYTYNYVKIWYL